MDAKITKEQFNQLIDDVALKLFSNSTEEFNTALNNLTEEQLKNPLFCDVIAITLAQNNAILVVKEVLTKMFFED